MYREFEDFNFWNEWSKFTGKNNSQDKDTLNKQLDKLNLALRVTYGSVFALFLYVEYLLYQRVKLLDLINDTNCADNLKNADGNEEIAGRIFLFATTVFLLLNLEGLDEIREGNVVDEKEVIKAEHRVTASTLAFLAACITRNDFNL